MRLPYNLNISYEPKSDFRNMKIKNKSTFGSERFGTPLFWSKEKMSKPTPFHYDIPSQFTKTMAQNSPSQIESSSNYLKMSTYS